MKFSSIYSQIISRLIADTLAFSASYFFQYYLRFKSGLVHSTISPDLPAIMLTGGVVVAYWLMLFFFSGMYKNWHLRSLFEEIFAVWKVALIGTALIVFLIYYDSQDSPRLLFLFYFLFLSLSTTIGRVAARRTQVILRQKRIVSIATVIIGSAKKSIEFYEKAKNSVNWGYRIVGIVLINHHELEEFEQIAKAKGINSISPDSIENLSAKLKELNAEEIVISTDKSDHSQLMDIVSEASEAGYRVNIEPDLYSIFTGQTRAQSLYGIPLIEIRTQLLKPWQEATKRAFDIVFSTLVIIIGLPFWLIIAMIVKLDSPGPVIYKQPRVGKLGKVFMIYKFRSMKPETTVKKQTWTTVNDPRVTKFGRFIRKTHIDEIPQFWNVLIGDMSVVGPRPEQPKIVDELVKELPYYKRRHIVRPGITGWWQVKYKSYEFSIEEIENRLKDDFYYIENLSLQLDFEIIARTIWLVIRGHGQT